MRKPSVDYRIHFVAESKEAGPEQMRRLLPVRPTSCRLITPKDGKPFVSWELYYSLRHSRDLDEAVRGLCSKLEPARKSIWRLAKRNICYFAIGCFYDCEKIAAPCIPMSAESVKALSSFRVPVYSHLFPCRR